MKNETLIRLQNWLQLHTNGNWEHQYGIKIATLDNPGWIIHIDLHDTCLNTLFFEKRYDSGLGENDWYEIKTRKQVLEITCGPVNLQQVLDIFFDEIIPHYADKNHIYDIYLPLQGHTHEAWLLAKATFISESSVKLVEMPSPDSKIVTREVEYLPCSKHQNQEFTHPYKVGDIFEIKTDNYFYSAMLTIK